MDAQSASGVVSGEDRRHSQVRREPPSARIFQGALLRDLCSQVGAYSSRVSIDEDPDPDDCARLMERPDEVRIDSVSLPPPPGRWRLTTDHDDALGQACVGQEINHTQPLGEPQGPEGRRLQGDGVGRGPWGWGDIARTQRPRLVRGEPGFCRQAAVQVGQLRGGSSGTQRLYFQG